MKHQGGRRGGPRLPVELLAAVGSRSQGGQKSKELSHKERRKAERQAKKFQKPGFKQQHADALSRPATSDPALRRKLQAAVEAGQRAAAQLAKEQSFQSKSQTGKRGRDSADAYRPGASAASSKRSKVSFGDGANGRASGKETAGRNGKPRLVDSDDEIDDDEDIGSDDEGIERGSAFDSGSEGSELDIEDDLQEDEGRAGKGAARPTSLSAALSSANDPHAEEDERLIAKLERKLGLRKGKDAAGDSAASKDEVAGKSGSGKGSRAAEDRAKALKKLNKAFAKEGLGDDFGDFLDGLDRVLYDKDGGKVRSDSGDAEDEDEEDVDEDGEPEDDEDMDDDGENEEEDASDDDAPEADEDEDEEEEEEEEMPELEPISDDEQDEDEDEDQDQGSQDNEDDEDDDDDDVDEDDYDEDEDGTDDMDEDEDEQHGPSSSARAAGAAGAAVSASGKYVPPHLRAKLSGGEAAAGASASVDASEGKASSGRDLYGRDLRGKAAVAEPDRSGAAARANTIGDGTDKRAAFFSRDVLYGVDLTSEAVQTTRRRLQGLINRLSEANVEAIAGEVSGVYKAQPHAVVNALLLHMMMKALEHETALLRPLALVYGALLGALHVLVGPGVGAAAVERLTLSFAEAAGLPYSANPSLEQLQASRPPPTMRDLELQARKAAASGGTSSSTAGAGVQAKAVPGKTRANLLLLLCYLLHFQVAHPALLAQLSALLVSRFAEADVELLLLFLTYGGWALRSDDPAALRDILKAVHAKLKDAGALPNSGTAAGVIMAAQAQAGKATSASAGGASQGPSLSVLDALEGTSPSGGLAAGAGTAQSASARLRVLGELLLDLKNNRKRGEVEQLLERAGQLRKWLTRLVSTREPALVGVDRRLRVAWVDLMMVPEMGRWWLVGSSWAGKQAAGGLSKATVGQATSESPAAAVPTAGAITAILGAAALASTGPAGAAAAGTDAGTAAAAAAEARIKASMSEADGQLYELARAMRMNTPARRSIFVALMGAEDVPSAVERVLRLDLKGPAEREVVRVALDCVGQEAGYNPFFAQVLGRLCSLHTRFKFTVQLALWDCFKVLEDEAAYTSRRVYNLARFTAQMLLPGPAGSAPVGKHGKASKDNGGHVTLATLKPLPFTAAERGASPRTLLFLKTLLSSVLLEARIPAAVTAVFSKVGGGPDKMLVRDGVSIALHTHTSVKTLLAAAPGHGATAAAMGPDELKERLKLARRALDSVSAAATDVEEL